MVKGEDRSQVVALRASGGRALRVLSLSLPHFMLHQLSADGFVGLFPTSLATISSTCLASVNTALVFSQPRKSQFLWNDEDVEPYDLDVFYVLI
jgi:hypothetical protein